MDQATFVELGQGFPDTLDTNGDMWYILYSGICRYDANSHFPPYLTESLIRRSTLLSREFVIAIGMLDGVTRST